jgi:quercetin dioxygenase-like cupin family protein
MEKASVKGCHYADAEAKAFGDEDSGMVLRWLINEEHERAQVYYLPIVELAQGKNTPEHTHFLEHEGFVLDGEEKVRIGEA